MAALVDNCATFFACIVVVVVVVVVVEVVVFIVFFVVIADVAVVSVFIPTFFCSKNIVLSFEIAFQKS